MSKFVSTTRLLVGSAALLATAAFVACTAEQPAWSPPDFSPIGMGWEGANGLEFIAVPGSPPAVTAHPDHPYINNAIYRRTGQQPTFHIADLTNPNLKQWAKDIMQKDNDEVLAGKIAYMPGQSCKHWGVPAVMQSGGPFFILQTLTEVVIIEEGERLARHIYLNVPHSANPKPSWYGESVGHYEGDTLVVDTIGITTETFVDFFRTPHTEKLHVVERWRLIDDGKQIEVHMTIDDPDTYHQPLAGDPAFGAHHDRIGREHLPGRQFQALRLRHPDRRNAGFLSALIGRA